MYSGEDGRLNNNCLFMPVCPLSLSFSLFPRISIWLSFTANCWSSCDNSCQLIHTRSSRCAIACIVLNQFVGHISRFCVRSQCHMINADAMINSGIQVLRTIGCSTDRDSWDRTMLALVRKSTPSVAIQFRVDRPVVSNSLEWNL